MYGDRPGTSRPAAGPAVSPTGGSSTPWRAATRARDSSSRPPAAAAAPTTSSDPALTRNERLLAGSCRATEALTGASAVEAGAGGSLLTSEAGWAERQARTASVAAPARTPKRAATAGRQAGVPGGRAPAHAPSAPNAARPTSAIQRRRLAATAKPAPSSSERTTTPATSTGLSLKPRLAMAARTTPMGARSITTLATDRTSDGAPGSAPATSSVAPSATPPATAPQPGRGLVHSVHPPPDRAGCASRCAACRGGPSLGARGNGPRSRGSVVAIVSARVLAGLGVFMWIVAAASFGEYQGLRPSLRAKIVAGASIGVPVLLGSALLAIAGLYLQR